MTPEEMRQRARELFLKRYHWSQVILAVGQEKLNKINEEVIKAVGAFGGGIASTGKVCGALLGGVALISSLYSRGNLEETEDPRMWKLSHKLARRFEEITREFGSVNCSDIARVNWSDREQVKEFYNHPDSRHQLCLRVVEDTASALGQILEEGEKENR